MQNREKIKTFKKESKVVWFLCFFSFKAIFKLNVIWQNFEQTLNFLFFFIVSGVRTPDLTYIYALFLSTELNSRGQNFEFIMN